LNAKKKSSKGWLLVLPALLLVVAVTVILVMRMEGEKPTINLEMTSPALGSKQTLTLHVADAKSGIRSVWVALLKDGQEIELLDKVFPAAGILSGGSVRKETVTFDFEPQIKGIKDGKAMLRLAVRDFSWRQWGKGNMQYQEKEVVIDTQPPVVDVLSRAHYFSQGGAGLVIYKLSEPCTTSGVMVGDTFYPGYSGQFKDSDIYMAMVAVDFRQGPGTPILVTATDYAGNKGRTGLPHRINARHFKQDTIRIPDSFLDWKMPEFVNLVDAPPGASNLDIFLIVNGKLRRENYEALARFVDKPDRQIHWEGVFSRLPSAANRAGFADHRSYVYNGRKIDEQTHLGIDLASLEQSPVPAGNAGKVVMAESLGIYGRTVLIDHGMGLFSMYSHLSHIGVNVGQMVAKEEIIGKTGRTGLAGGDHLHYSILVNHTFVNPVEWWDAQWVKNNITSKIEAVE